MLHVPKPPRRPLLIHENACNLCNHCFQGTR